MRRSVGVAVDVGTSVVKVAAFDEVGHVLGRRGAPAPVLRPQPGFSEYDTYDVWAAVCTAVRELVADLDADVDRISATGQGDGCWLIDDRDEPVGHALLWNDGRAGSIVHRWHRDGTDTQAFAINGSASFPGSQGALLAWLREHEPQRLEAATTALFCTGWLTWRLSGERVTDVSDAGLPWLDIRAETWSERVLELLDLEWSAALRPRMLRRGEQAGTLRPDAAADLGLRPGIPVTHGTFDSVAMATGADVLRPGETLAILGTTLIVEGVSDRVDTSGAPSGMTLCTDVEGTRLRLYGTFSGTDSLDWAARLYGCSTAAEYLAAAEQSPAGARGLHMLPYFSPAGERAPFINAYARASVAGLSLDHGLPDLARAHLEALTYSLRHCLEQLPAPPETMVICGGGAASSWWCQLIADATGLPVESVGGIELGALGADVAARAQRDGSSIVDAAVMSRPAREHFEPRAVESRMYDDGYGRYTFLRERAEETWGPLAGVETA